MTPEQWHAKGREIVVPDGRIFTVTLGEERGAPPVLVLHGFPSSSWDFDEVASRMAEDRRVLLFDLLGFGYSDKPEDAGYSIFEHADVAIAVVRAAKAARVHVWAHDLGTSVATELLARRERGLLPFEIASIVLMNGSVHVEMASLTAGQRLLRSRAGDAFVRIAGPRVFRAQMRRILARPVEDAVLDGMWALIARADGNLRLPKTIHYVEERFLHHRRWVGALERLDIPALIAWGTKDPVALLAIGERLARETPGAEMVCWDDLGHYPQLEDPARVASVVKQFLTRAESPSTRSDEDS